MSADGNAEVFTHGGLQTNAAWMRDLAPTQTRRQYKDPTVIVIQYGGLMDEPEYIVRKLTPTEAERLMGFPDGYTDIDGATDTVRYKALGNSMVVPVMRWIGERIQAVEVLG